MVTGMPALAFLASALADRASRPSRLRPRRVRYWPEVLVGVTLRGRELTQAMFEVGGQYRRNM